MSEPIVYTVDLFNADFFTKEEIKTIFEKNGFKLKPIPIWQNRHMGTFRFSGNGKIFAFYNITGIFAGKI